MRCLYRAGDGNGWLVWTGEAHFKKEKDFAQSVDENVVWIGACLKTQLCTWCLEERGREEEDKGKPVQNYCQ